jgi:hypothetical protein
MKSLTICLPDIAFAKASTDASRHGVDAANYCASILADHLLSAHARPSVTGRATGSSGAVANSKFVVAEHFPEFPAGSVSLAQTFVDEAQKFAGVDASRVRRGIGFKPNFVFIEYLMSRGGKEGIGVSFYGEPARHENPPSILVRGIPSYSRAKIHSKEDLQAILPHVRQSYELKFGVVPTT